MNDDDNIELCKADMNYGIIKLVGLRESIVATYSFLFPFA
jgi:hypothetical protein